MKPLAEMYRDGLVRAIVPERPAMSYLVHQPTVLADYCELLAECAEAKRLLRANGHGKPGMSVLELVQLLLTAAPASTKPARAPPERKTLMAQTTITATIKWRWWLKHYLLGVVIVARLTGCRPSRERMRYWLDKGIKIEFL